MRGPPKRLKKAQEGLKETSTGEPMQLRKGESAEGSSRSRAGEGGGWGVRAGVLMGVRTGKRPKRSLAGRTGRRQWSNA